LRDVPPCPGTGATKLPAATAAVEPIRWPIDRACLLVSERDARSAVHYRTLDGC